MTVNHDLHDLIRKRLEAIDMTQSEMAFQIGVDPSQLSRILNGKSDPPLVDAPRWGEVLKMNGDQRDELTLAMNLRVTPPLVLEYLRKIASDREVTTRQLERCSKRLAMAKKVFDQIDWESIEGDAGGQRGPLPD